MLFKIFLIVLGLLVLYYFCVKPVLDRTGTEVPREKQDEGQKDLELPPKTMTDKERLKRLSQSDPERAKDLIKQWLREDE